MAWIWLLAAGACEIVWAVGLKKFGFTFASLGGLGTLVVMVLSFVLLAQAMKTLPLGTCYPVWVGIGALGTAVVGMSVLGESTDWRRIACIGLIVAGVVGLKALTRE
jgi:quaternary ammonium compound-resistance protein SugE